MDPISIIGTAGSIANIIDVVAKIINTIRELTDEYKEADLRFMTLVTQLTALRAAFKKIQEWIDSDLVGDPYHQLVMDLDVSISCCRLLTGKIEAMLIELCEEEEGKLDVSSKMKLVFSKRNLDGLQKFITQQTAALTLLLTACNCKTLSDQKVLLEKSSTRRAVRRMEADTTSLFVHRDSDSFVTQMTDRLSKLSVEFTFDWELFITKVYERALRGSLKESIRTLTVDLEAKKYTKTPKLDYEAMKRSQALDRRIEEDSRRRRRECNILVLGSADEKDKIIKQMKIVYGNGYSEDELKLYRLAVHKNLMESVKSLIWAMQLFEIEPEREENKAMCRMLMDYDIPVDRDVVIDKTIGHAISAVWTDPCIPKVIEHASEFYLMDNAPYFFEEAERIASGDYIPTEADILQTKTKTTGIYETRFTTGQLSIHMFDVGGQRSERMKWIHCFENVTSIIYVVDLADYDRVLLEDSSQNRMMESLALFDSVVNSRWFRNTSIILFLSNVSLFKQKLARSPLSIYFPDYSGGNDVNRAVKYILWRFNQVNRAHLQLYPHLVVPNDTSNIRLVFAAVKETILQNYMRSGLRP